MEKRKIIVFDMDETLVHSNSVHMRALNDAFEKNGYKRIVRVKDLTGESTFFVIKKLLPKISDKDVMKIVEDRRKLVVKYAHLSRAIKGAKKILKKLSLKYDLALLSNCFHKDIPKILKSSGIDIKLFKIFLGKDDVGKPKPSSDGLVKISKKLHERVEYMVGDSIYDVMAGKKLKVKTISVLTGNTDIKLIIKEKPDYILDSVADIGKVIK